MNTFKTDDNGNLLLNDSGSFIDLSEKEAIAQNIKSAIMTNKGEWFLDQDLGVDRENGFEKGGGNLLIYSIKTVVLGVLGVVSIEKLIIDFDKNLRQLFFDGKINSEEGQIYIKEVF